MSWKDFLIKHPWAPPRLLKGIDPEFDSYDLSNWERKDSVRLVLDRKEWKIQKSGMGKEKARRILKAVWKYRICERFAIDIKSNDAVEKIISKRIPRDDELSTFNSAVYLRQTEYKYDSWKSRGYTNFSFVCFHLYPGKEWCEKVGLMPQMFLQTEEAELSDGEILAMFEIIWLRHIRSLKYDATQEQINLQKEIFFARHNDKDLFNRKDEWSRYGIGGKISARKNGLKEWEKLLATKFAIDLGLIEEDLPESIRWNASTFRKKFPDMQLTKCYYTNKIPTDLHHLLPRSEFPELIYEPENVVPLDTAVHAFITRGKWDESLKKEYLDAQQNWLKAEKGKKIDCFQLIMEKIIDSMNPN